MNELDILRQYQPPTIKLKTATWGFEIRRKSGQKVWGGTGFVSERARDEAIAMALHSLTRLKP